VLTGPAEKRSVYPTPGQGDAGYRPHPPPPGAGGGPDPARVRAWRGLARGTGKYGMRAWGCEKKNPKRNPRKPRSTSLVIPLQLPALGVDAACILRARGRPRRAGLERAAGGAGRGAGPN